MDPTSTTPGRILVVDDDEDVRRMLGLTLKRDGYECAFALDGEEALNAAVRERPDIILLDLDLPRLDGLGVVERLRTLQDLAGVTVVILSAEDSVERKVAALKAGADLYLTKPIQPRELLAHVEAVLRMRRRSLPAPSPTGPAAPADGGADGAKATLAGRDTEKFSTAALSAAMAKAFAHLPADLPSPLVAPVPPAGPARTAEATPGTPGAQAPRAPTAPAPSVTASASGSSPVPAAPAPAPPAAATAPTPPPGPAASGPTPVASSGERRARVLLVDADAAMATALARTFAARGIVTEVEPNVLAAIHRLERERFDAVLLDLDLERTSGAQVVREMRRRRDAETLPILAVSAAGHPETIQAAFEAGANDFIEKPFQPQVLVVKLEMQLRRLRALRFFQQAAGVAPARGPEGTLLVESALELGRYRLLHAIDAGASGTVYRAETQDGTAAAVKVLAVGGRVGPESVLHFQREAAALAALRHANIVRVLEAGQVMGYYFIAMEWVEGPSLRSRIEREGPLPWKDLRRIGLDVGRALDCAATHGIVHRDVKPANILFRSAGEPVLSDFGVALAAREPSEARNAAPARFGSPLYMSPEAVRGEPLDIRSDLYSFGATLYHATAASPPFPGPLVDAVYAAQLSAPPPPLQKRRPDLPPAFIGAVLKLLEKAPAQRFQTPAEWIAEVEALPAGA